MKKILVLFAKDWDRLEFSRPEYRGRYEFIHEGFDLFRFPDNARLLTFDVFAYINALKLIPYYALGQITLGSIRTALVLMPIAAASVYLGVWLVKRLSERVFFLTIIWLLLIVGLDLVGKGVLGRDPFEWLLHSLLRPS